MAGPLTACVYFTPAVNHERQRMDTGVVAVSTSSDANRLSAIVPVTVPQCVLLRMQGPSPCSVGAASSLSKGADGGVLSLSRMLVVFL